MSTQCLATGPHPLKVCWNAIFGVRDNRAGFVYTTAALARGEGTVSLATVEIREGIDTARSIEYGFDLTTYTVLPQRHGGQLRERYHTLNTFLYRYQNSSSSGRLFVPS